MVSNYLSLLAYLCFYFTPPLCKATGVRFARSLPNQCQHGIESEFHGERSTVRGYRYYKGTAVLCRSERSADVGDG